MPLLDSRPCNLSGRGTHRCSSWVTRGSECGGFFRNKNDGRCQKGHGWELLLNYSQAASVWGCLRHLRLEYKSLCTFINKGYWQIATMIVKKTKKKNKMAEWGFCEIFLESQKVKISCYLATFRLKAAFHLPLQSSENFASTSFFVCWFFSVNSGPSTAWTASRRQRASFSSPTVTTSVLDGFALSNTADKSRGFMHCLFVLVPLLRNLLQPTR